MMNTAFWEEKLRELRSHGRIVTAPGAGEAELARFEAACGIRLPAPYRDWLQISDGGLLFPPAGLQLYGVAHKPLLSPADKGCPEGYLPAGTMPYGDPILLEKETGRFALYNQERGEIAPEETFPDFLAFLDRLPALLGLED